MSEISTGARRELIQAVRGRYQTESTDGKHRILDEFVAVTGYHRKHAIRILNGSAASAAAGSTCGRMRV
jgi:hypothetical protein